ncbi:O-acetyl-ADP-ribose deacetylase [Carboxylicivirga marina]|uniref:O-acetyl-ADP-ribose deacetylase n=1 Tax=Carboxylicivirga marina TaxID=2800988 RepID=A0ABS1HG42_9BACT|nr:O-acetyl-ADP-ribose deacetylase [Carboxylicivirga marina]MBK3516547.1 O-acetyl-ADP-ribose deacetylase [Carboxylicivirga marina]
MELELMKGDITQIHVDAIVNAANSGLMGGGGVDGAIHKAGGPEIMAECRLIRERQGGCPTGEAVLTTSGLLPAKNLIHTVGPIWKGGNNDEKTKLQSCYLNSLKLAEEHQLSTIAFPNISTGVYGYPKSEAAEVAVNAVKSFKSKSLSKVIFVCFDDENHQIYAQLLSE